MSSENESPTIREFSNNIVAQSDYEVAMMAIESTFASFEFRGVNGMKEHDQERIAEVYQEAKASLLRNLNRIVQPIDDIDFHDYVDPYHIILEDYDDINEELRLPPIEEEEIDDEEEEEIDVEELVDQRAWKDAQDLRSRIRRMSQTVQNVRERILQHSEEGLVSSLERHLKENEIEILEDEECLEDSTPMLQDSLHELSRILQDPQWSKLPHRIQSLQDTIEAIQNESAEDRPMSQTEIAILSQNSESDSSIIEASRNLLDDSAEAMSTDIVTAMDRLAMLGQYL
jgi:hypothetical protein